ncbi:hypothetical protein CEXT_803731 [Caerostris extrusa]|uniref:Uncharacterized protein n=1 Tax=Caerostris extrusa TaxID=172846 RepID=A0AAV4YFL1_CAEEX|nr:hypothetical protein CEXT_803731 [Caerostris extrusa]
MQIGEDSLVAHEELLHCTIHILTMSSQNSSFIEITTYQLNTAKSSKFIRATSLDPQIQLIDWLGHQRINSLTATSRSDVAVSTIESDVFKKLWSMVWKRGKGEREYDVGSWKSSRLQRRGWPAGMIEENQVRGLMISVMLAASDEFMTSIFNNSSSTIFTMTSEENCGCANPT